MHRAEQVCRNGSFNKILSLYTSSFSHACGQRLYIYGLFVQHIHSEKCFNIEFFNLQPVCFKCWLVPWGLYIHNKCFYIEVCFRIVIFLFCSVEKLNNYLLVVPESRHFNHKLLMLPESIILRKWAFQFWENELSSLTSCTKLQGDFIISRLVQYQFYLERKESFWRR
jgi:hypothetical protein